jgi:anti-sigma B factor antagonist
MGSADVLRITVDNERRAVALAQELSGVSDVVLQPERGKWVVSLKAADRRNHLVMRVLDAVRRSLAGEPTASALVMVDGHEYQMQGEVVNPMNSDWGRDGSTVADGIRSERSGEDTFVVSLAGEHDLYTAPKVQEALRSVIADGARTTVVDLTETTFLDSTMLHLLLNARKELGDSGRLLLVTDDAAVKRVFEVAGIDRFFDFYPSRRAAEASKPQSWSRTGRQGAQDGSSALTYVAGIPSVTPTSIGGSSSERVRRDEK